ncbi:MAG TPA: hypothetical protein VM899_03515 [Rubellimicrobium sp.]|jgi:hypothetical protein|nr:hypothetical protein [Rubellimicrobium sp.]
MPEARSFLCAPGLRIEAEARLTELQVARVDATLARLEGAIDRLEKRLWLTVYGVVAVILATAAQSIMGIAT